MKTSTITHTYKLQNKTKRAVQPWQKKEARENRDEIEIQRKWHIDGHFKQASRTIFATEQTDKTRQFSNKKKLHIKLRKREKRTNVKHVGAIKGGNQSFIISASSLSVKYST